MRSQSNVPWMRSMASKMQMKFDKYWGDCNLLISIAAVLDPRNKMTLINFSFKVMYSEEEASWQINIVRDSLYELYREYVEAYKANNITESLETDMGENLITSVSTESGEDVELVPWRSRFEDYVRKNTIQDAKSELDTYLEEGVFICKEHPSHFDALDWWKANNLKFRILSKMACEILSIPITTVASESTFSAGGRVIDTYRSSLGTDTVQMLLCGSDWYRHFYSLKRKVKSNEEVKEIPLV